jgi:hypothetical protein
VETRLRTGPSGVQVPTGTTNFSLLQNDVHNAEVING